MDEAGGGRVILKVIAGSRAHGLATDGSDTDTRGVCIPAARFLLGLASFEQHESDGGDHVVYSLRKFVRLALQGNPNIVETLYTDDEHVLTCDAHGQALREFRHGFLSRHVGERFMRYGMDQLGRMERHHRWLVDPPEREPLPDDYGATQRDGRAKFPDADAQRAYKAAHKHFENWRRWRERRNPVRAELEERHGYDTKHAMHLCRLLRMGREILEGRGVNVRRSDADWLRGVRAGGMSYEALLEWASAEIAALPGLMAASVLPDEPDREGADALVVRLHRDFLASTDATD